jgi:hypothetical protein
MRQALPQLREVTDAMRQRAVRFNTVVAQRGDGILAAPALGSGLHLAQPQGFVYGQVVGGTEISTEAIAAAIRAEFARRGVQLKGEGGQVQTSEETLAILQREVAPVLSEWLPQWRQLGVL